MSDIAGGPGWWLASDGKWYPPQTHPAARVPPPPPPVVAAPPPVVPSTAMAAIPRSPTATGAPAPTGASASPWSAADYRWEDSTFAGRQRRASAGRMQRTADARGAFVVVVSLLLVAACFVPYYNVSRTFNGSLHMTVANHALGQWRVAIPAVCILTALVGVVNSILRVGQTGAVAVFFVLRLLVFAQLGAWVVPIVLKKIPTSVTPHPPTLTFGWAAYVCIGVALIAVFGSFASIGKASDRR